MPFDILPFTKIASTRVGCPPTAILSNQILFPRKGLIIVIRNGTHKFRRIAMNTDTRPIVEIIDTLFKEKRVMQRCDRCILRNRMARIPCTIPSSDPALAERVLRATFQPLHEKPCRLVLPSGSSRSQETRLPRSSPHTLSTAPPSVAAAHFSTAVVGVSSTLSPVGAPGGTASVVGLTELLAGLGPSEFRDRTWIAYCVFGFRFVTRWVVPVLPVAPLRSRRHAFFNVHLMVFNRRTAVFADASHSKSMKSVRLTRHPQI